MVIKLTCLRSDEVQLNIIHCSLRPEHRLHPKQQEDQNESSPVTGRTVIKIVTALQRRIRTPGLWAGPDRPFARAALALCQKYDQRISASAVASSSWDSEVPYKIFESPLPGSVCSEPKIRFSTNHYMIFHDCYVTFGLDIYMTYRDITYCCIIFNSKKNAFV